MQNKENSRLMRNHRSFYFAYRGIIWRKSGRKINHKRERKEDYMVKIQKNNKRKNIEKKQIKWYDSKVKKEL